MVNKDRPLSFGVELELANVDRTRSIPVDIGSWECGDRKNTHGVYIGKEKCIINSDFSVVDPDGIKCTKGGEIHVVPSFSIDTLVDRIKKIFNIFPEADMFLPGKMHIHVGIPEWTFEELKNIVKYTSRNDTTLMKSMCPDDFMDSMMNDSNIGDDLKQHYLESRCAINNPLLEEEIDKYDTKKEVSYWWGAGVLYFYPKAKIYYHNAFMQTKPRVRSQSIHIQHLIAHDTVEFRNFAPTMNIEEIRQCLLVAQKYVREALNGYDGSYMKDWIKDYTLPTWKYDSKYINKWWEIKKQMPSNTSEASKGFHTFDVV